MDAKEAGYVGIMNGSRELITTALEKHESSVPAIPTNDFDAEAYEARWMAMPIEVYNKSWDEWWGVYDKYDKESNYQVRNYLPPSRYPEFDALANRLSILRPILQRVRAVRTFEFYQRHVSRLEKSVSNPPVTIDPTPTVVAKIIPLSKWQLFRRLFQRHPNVIDL
jgi:hypothetical protein